jgi:hypothetical protein
MLFVLTGVSWLLLVWYVAEVCVKIAAMISVAVLGAGHASFLSRKTFLGLCFASLLRLPQFFFYERFALLEFGTNVVSGLCVVAATARVFLSDDCVHDVFSGWGFAVAIVLALVFSGGTLNLVDLLRVIAFFVEAFALLPMFVLLESKRSLDDLEVLFLFVFVCFVISF